MEKDMNKTAENRRNAAVHFAHGDHIADFHLARRLGISAVYRHLVRAHGICGIAAGLEHPHRPKILVQTNIVHIT